MRSRSASPEPRRPSCGKRGRALVLGRSARHVPVVHLVPARWLEIIGLAVVLGAVPLLWAALRALAERDWVGGGLMVVAAAAAGHLGLELVAIARLERRPEPGGEP